MTLGHPHTLAGATSAHCVPSWFPVCPGRQPCHPCIWSLLPAYQGPVPFLHDSLCVLTPTLAGPALCCTRHPLAWAPLTFIRVASCLPCSTWPMAGPPGDETPAPPHPQVPEPRQAPGTASGDTWPAAAPQDGGREPQGPCQSHSLSEEGRSRDHTGGGRPRAPESSTGRPRSLGLGSLPPAPSRACPCPVPAGCRQRSHAAVDPCHLAASCAHEARSSGQGGPTGSQPPASGCWPHPVLGRLRDHCELALVLPGRPLPGDWSTADGWAALLADHHLPKAGGGSRAESLGFSPCCFLKGTAQHPVTPTLENRLKYNTLKSTHLKASAQQKCPRVTATRSGLRHGSLRPGRWASLPPLSYLPGADAHRLHAPHLCDSSGRAEQQLTLGHGCVDHAALRSQCFPLLLS